MATKKESFLSKAYVYPSIWAIIIGLLGFLGGMIWKNWSGPDKVIVLNREPNNSNSKDTTITIIRFQPDEKYFNNLAKMTSREMQKTYQNGDKKSKTKEDLDSLSTQIAKEYQLKYDSLSLLIMKKEIKTPLVSSNILSLPDIIPNYNVSQINRPKFKMPSTVEGYSEGLINSYASFILNSTLFNKKDKIEISIDFFDRTIIDNLTPVFIELVEPKTANSVYFIWGEQYQIRSKRNMITFSADFKLGKYLLTIGFYQLDEINRKYPPFYCKRYNIEII